MAGLKEAKELGPRVDALEKELSEVYKEISKIYEGISGTNTTLDELLGVVGEIAQKAEPKQDPRIGELMIQMNELREMVKRAATPPSKEDKGVSDFLIIVGIVFCVSLLASSISGWFYKPAKQINYSERVLYNQLYREHGSSIGLYESESDAARKIENQKKYEDEQKRKAAQ